jgi:Sec-independent protein secretion pathway component TatC
MGLRKLREEEPDERAAGATMGFLEHLDELRTRLIRACSALAAGMLVSCFFVDRIVVLTPSPDPRNQLLFAAPMLGMYLVGIVIAWLVQPRTDRDAADGRDTALRLVFAASVLDQARRQSGADHERTASPLRAVAGRPRG